MSLDLSTLRAGENTSTPYLSIAPLEVVATARVNQSVFSRPLAQLTMDTLSGWTGVQVGMVVWIGTSAGARDVFVGRIRATPTSTVCYVNEMSPGDFGQLPQATLTPLADNQYITVLRDMAFGSIFPSIEEGVFYKDKIAYSSQNSNPPAIVNLGEHIAGWVDPDTGVLTVTKSVYVSPWRGESVASRVTSLGGGTFISGNNNSTTWTATFPPGHYLISCSVTLSSGANTTVYRHVFAHDPETYPPLSVNINSDRRDRVGRKVALSVLETAEEMALYDGAFALLWFDGAKSVAGSQRQVAGYLEQSSLSIDASERSTSFELLSAIYLLQGLRAFSQQLTIASSPANWQEIPSDLAHLPFAVFYLLYWHSRILHLFDANFGAYTAWQKQSWVVQPGNLVAQVTELCSRLNAWLGQSSNGTLYLRRDPLLMSQSHRNALNIRVTLTETDIASISYDDPMRPPVGRVDGTAFAFDSGETEAFRSMSPGHVGGQGADYTNLDNQLVLSQAELNERTANQYAKLNNPLSRISVTLPSDYDIFEPSDNLWFQLDLASDCTPDGNALNTRAQALEVSKSYQVDGSAQVSVVFEAESSGVNAPGQSIPIPIPDDLPSYNDDATLSPIYDIFIPPISLPVPEPSEPALAAIRLLAWADEGLGASVSIASSPNFSLLYTPAEGNLINGVELDPFCEKVQGLGSALGLYILEQADTDTLVIYEPDALSGSALFGVAYTLEDANASLVRAVRRGGVTGGVLVYAGQQGVLVYSDDYLDTVSLETFGEGMGGDGAADADDFDLGIILAAGTDDEGAGCVFYTPADYSATPLMTDIPSPSVGLNPAYDFTVSDHGWVNFSWLETEPNPCGSYGTYTPGVGWTSTYRNGACSGSADGFQNVSIKKVLGGNYLITKIEVDTVAVNGGYFGGARVRLYQNGEQQMTTVTTNPATGSHTLVFNTNYHADTVYFLAEIVDYGDPPTPSLTVTNIRIYGAPVAEFNLIRIPHRQFGDGVTLNDNAEALDMICGVSGLSDDGWTLRKITLDTSAGAMLNDVDVTPIIEGVKHYPIGPHALEASGANSRKWLMFGKAITGGAVALLYTDDAGATWEKVSDFNGRYVQWVNSSSAWLAGQGIRVTTDNGATLHPRNGNFIATIDQLPVLGVRRVGL